MFRKLIIVLLMASSELLIAQTVQDSLVIQKSSLLFEKQITQTTDSSLVTNPSEKKINYTTLAILGGVNVGAFVSAHLYQAHVWWNMFKPNNGFKIDWDHNYALFFDKEGHFMAGHFLAQYVSSIFEVSNFDTESSRLYAAGISLAYETYIEVMDGTSKGYDFAPDDYIADVLGSSYFLAQHYFPYLKNFQPRISYWPSKTILNGSKDHNVFDDYEGQKHWIAVRMKEVLPKNIAIYWPKFLMISFGTAIKDYFTNSENRHREFYIALDLDPEIIPFEGKFWQFVKNLLSYVHFPLPGLRISPKISLFGFCY